VSTSSLEAFSDRWSEPSYEVRIRGTAFLWGSAGLVQDLTFAQPVVLHLRNDVHGEPITLGSRVAAGTQANLGTLAPGECVSIQLQGISGVFAVCTLESTVACLLRH
jgi:hypothetical protein